VFGRRSLLRGVHVLHPGQHLAPAVLLQWPPAWCRAVPLSVAERALWHHHGV
jgi:hypothetical protein